LLSYIIKNRELIKIAAKCIKLELARPPEFIPCAVGEPADISNLYINAFFDDDSRDTLAVSYKMFSEPDLHLVTEQRQSIISYAGQTLKVNIPVRNARLDNIEAVPRKPLVYQTGDSFHKEDIIVTAYYSDGSNRVIQNYKCSPFYSIKQETKEIKIRYGACKAFVSIDVTDITTEHTLPPAKAKDNQHHESLVCEKTIVAISIAKRPNRQRYLLGDSEVDLTGGKLDLIYSDGSVGQIDMISDSDVFIDSSAVGQGEVKFTCLGKTISFYVEVLEPQVVKLCVDKQPIRTNYSVGEILDLTGLVLQATYNDGTTRPVYGLQSNDYIVSLADNENGVTLAYEQHPFVVSINVTNPSEKIHVIDVSIGRVPYKTQYIEREAKKPDLTGAELLLQMNDGRRQAVPVNDDMVVEFNIDTPGQGILKIAYENVIINFSITVQKRSLLSLECDSSSSKYEYLENESFDLKGVVLYALYDNGEKEVVSNYKIAKNKASREDTCVTLNYKGLSVSYPISVKPLDNTILLGLNILQYPKTVYHVGESFDPAGMIVEAVYSGDISKVVDVSYIPDRALRESDKHILICFENKAVMLPVTVKNQNLEITQTRSNDETAESFSIKSDKKPTEDASDEQDKIETIELMSEPIAEQVVDDKAQKIRRDQKAAVDSLPNFYPSSFALRFEDPPDDFAF